MPAYVSKGSAGDLVTELDRKIERSLSEALRSVLPGSAVVGEEFGPRGTSTVEWIVDPIDGTTNLVHGVEHVAVCVALTVRARPVLAVVHNPFARSTFYATAGGGGFVRRHGLPERSDEQLVVSRVGRLRDSLVGFGLPYDRSRSERIFGAAAAVFRECQDLRRRGSASLDLISIAEGALDGHFELDLRMWDVVAAGLVLEEAGGVISSWDGEALSWTSSEDKLNVVASNRLVHDELLRVVRSAAPDG